MVNVIHQAADSIGMKSPEFLMHFRTVTSMDCATAKAMDLKDFEAVVKSIIPQVQQRKLDEQHAKVQGVA